ncbi:hypothetical protein SLEP1_g57573 [Rubroshorea leprosula]|uniref:Uncharacterized protein n=1 Tax=Rubroshorea leprosula TaxID=152421 RepID=A0AAV5MNB4_9ROSI|nr:hypothetical protein SLEP1_g57573 [Rubroshorea leprosula]
MFETPTASWQRMFDGDDGKGKLSTTSHFNAKEEFVGAMA